MDLNFFMDLDWQFQMDLDFFPNEFVLGFGFLFHLGLDFRFKKLLGFGLGFHFANGFKSKYPNPHSSIQLYNIIILSFSVTPCISSRDTKLAGGGLSLTLINKTIQLNDYSSFAHKCNFQSIQPPPINQTYSNSSPHTKLSKCYI